MKVFGVGTDVFEGDRTCDECLDGSEAAGNKGDTSSWKENVD